MRCLGGILPPLAGALTCISTADDLGHRLTTR